jgi:hypothetical protein
LNDLIEPCCFQGSFLSLQSGKKNVLIIYAPLCARQGSEANEGAPSVTP